MLFAVPRINRNMVPGSINLPLGQFDRDEPRRSAWRFVCKIPKPVGGLHHFVVASDFHRNGLIGQNSSAGITAVNNLQRQSTCFGRIAFRAKCDP